ncbi:MAG: GNAT family N-acetyltransferase [Archangiaceae bacterium]|nr:GNAT family N-acetyltransferase [Archangiaceae bacterium]
MRVEVIRQLSELPKEDLHLAEGLQPFMGDDEPVVVAAFEQSHCHGLLPLKRSIERPIGLDAVKLSRASPLHGRVCDHTSRAMLEFVIANEPFSLLELGAVPTGGPVARVIPELESFRHGIDCLAGPLRATVQLGHDLDAWFYGLQGWAAPLARRTRSLLSSGEVEIISACDPRAGRDLLAMYLELEQRADPHGLASDITGDPRRAARYAALAESGATLFTFLLLDGLPIAGTLSLTVGDTVYQLESARDPGFEDLAPDEVLLMFELRRAICRGAKHFELGPAMVPHHGRLGARPTETQVWQVFRRFGSHHFGSAWSSASGGLDAPMPLHGLPGRSDLALQLKARRQASTLLARLESIGADVERLWGDPLCAGLPFDVSCAEHERVRRAV